ncbi:MAG: 4'-phosphopantetheinyl transferase superfamily protein [Methylobacter sp.]|jgi:4'-phosphopantetheinyl transferase EntD|nr:4'-phosphopantetheinyl transferase superfamily protein [Methylobacter sp.]
MFELSRDIERIECSLKQWFPGQAFIKAARIQHYPILPEERALVVNAVSSRQHEFATGRWLSRQGLQSWGLPDWPIKTGELRNPLWPEPVIGTISHDGELCAVVLMQKHQHSESGIGIDLVSLPQRTGRMDELAPMFLANADELGVMAAFNIAVDPALLLFSVKESVVKAMSLQLGDFIDMRAIEIHCTDKLSFRISGNSVSAEILAATTGNYLVTAVKVG